MFTGTLIEDLIATVDRVEQSSHANEATAPDYLITDSWMAQAVKETVTYDSKFLFWQRSGVA